MLPMCGSPEDGQLNLADPGNNHFFAFLDALDLTESESGGCKNLRAWHFHKTNSKMATRVPIHTNSILPYIQV